MVNTADWKTGQVNSLFPSLLFLFRCFQFQVVRFRCIQITDSFSLVKKYDPSIYFHKTDLFRIGHFFTGSAKPAFIGKDYLFHHQLHLVIQ